MTPIKFWPTSREPEFGEGAGSLQSQTGLVRREHKVVGEGGLGRRRGSQELGFGRLRVRPVWVGENVMAREPGAFTRIRKVRPVWVGENVNWLAREPGDSERAITSWRARGDSPLARHHLGSRLAREPGYFYVSQTSLGRRECKLVGEGAGSLHTNT